MRYSFPTTLIFLLATHFYKYHRQYKTVIFGSFWNNENLSLKKKKNLPRSQIREIDQSEVALVRERWVTWSTSRNNHSQPDSLPPPGFLEWNLSGIMSGLAQDPPTAAHHTEVKTWSPYLTQFVLASDYLSDFYVLTHLPSQPPPPWCPIPLPLLCLLFLEQVKHTRSSAPLHLLFPLCKMLFPHKTTWFLPLFLSGLC